MKGKNESPRDGEIRDLIRQFQHLKAGRSHKFLDEDSYERIIDYYDDVEDLSQAMEAAEWATEHFPYSSSLMIRKADLLLATRKYRKALELLDRVESLDKNDINIYILKTDALLALDLQQQAVTLLENALQLFEGEERLELLFELADVYDDYEEFGKVFDCMALVLEQDPVNEEALYKICFWADFTKRNEESILIHQRILDEHPFSELAWFNLAAAFQGLKLYEKAIDAYKYAVAIDEKFDFAYRNMADAFMRIRKYREAIEALERVAELARPEEVIFEAIGYCHDRLKQFAQARFYYRKASHLNQEDSKLQYKIACTYLNEQQWNPAMKHLELALQLHRMQPDYNLAMGECLLHQGRFKEAIPYYSVVVRQRAKTSTGWQALIRCLYLGGFHDEALVQIKEAMRNVSGKPVFDIYAAAALFALGRSREAMQHLGSALATNPRLLKKLIEINPALLQNPLVADIAARYKRSRSI